jgi:hypothetical protein
MGSMSVGASVFPSSMLVFPSMPKGRLLENWFGQLVVIDVNPYRLIQPLEIDVNTWRLMSTLGEVWKP